MPRRRTPPWQVAGLFRYAREAAAYEAAVDVCLADPATARRLGKRPQATAENVRVAMLAEANVRRALEPCQENQRHFRHALRRHETTRDRVDYLHDPPAPETVVLALLSLGLLVSLVAAPWTYVGVLALMTAGAGLAVRRHPLWSMHVRHNVSELGLKAVLFVRERQAEAADRRWRLDLQLRGVGPLMQRVVEALLGDDPDSLLLPDDYEGLRSPRNRQYVIDNEAARRLARKVAQREGGTIAVSGPRGAGKSTLLESCAEEADLAVVVQAPATYSPYEFLLSLFVTVCETYLTEHGSPVPDVARLSGLHRAVRRLVPLAGRVTRYLGFALAAGALVVLGLSASLRAVAGRYDDPVLLRARELWSDLTGTAAAVWRGESVGAALVAALIGLVLWWMRRPTGLGTEVRAVWPDFCSLSGFLLVLGAPVSLLFDSDVHRHARDLLHQSPGELALLLGLGLLLALLFLAPDVEWTVGGVTVVINRYLQAGVGGMLAFGLLPLLMSAPSRAVATDAGNPLRLACLLLGVLLIRARSWTVPQPEPPLVTECRDQLYRLQTVQTSSAAVTTGLPQLLTAHTTSLSTVPPTMPKLVSDFRDLLTDIAKERYARKGRVVIAIDEVDRLGSDAEALAFLGEIKAILGVPHVHYLISVAEDVGASFVRRGLPHRGVTDSSLDDIVHVQPCTLAESKAILEQRTQGLREPYTLLVHGLSGGLPRDLIRYGLRIMEIEDKTRFYELTDISRQMILEELAETLAGFRTLLAKQQWTAETSPVLLSFRSLMGHLQYLCPCPSADLTRALHHVAFYDLDQQLGPAAAQVPEPTRLLIDEAATYVLFSLTLLDIFGRPDLARRRAEAARRSPDGNPDLLAQARQELEVSPYSARPLIAAVRASWALPDRPSSSTLTTIPRPRSSPCPVHSGPAGVGDTGAGDG
ncbi:hypothetical protein [Streptomyces aurantiogriseus]|uniref:KAP NTPase domain-containing protein n=1 Tax=Streptomyces aurantiogriseus TaxID=66870 RepID=A0A918CIX7_9ACTN|nr:hypothetical protein [Streptomyces aurantiogriseus]GGR23352.1 hypothetical protein GCM10010251_44270 [Streptomyces aurantiogriseus]